MDIGVLWEDDDPKRPIAEKIKRAAAFYADKYGAPPTTCVINAATLGDETLRAAGGCRVLTARTVQINHFWLGVETE